MNSIEQFGKEGCISARGREREEQYVREETDSRASSRQNSGEGGSHEGSKQQSAKAGK